MAENIFAIEMSGHIDTLFEAIAALLLVIGLLTLLGYAAGTPIRVQLESPRNWDRTRGSH